MTQDVRIVLHLLQIDSMFILCTYMYWACLTASRFVLSCLQQSRILFRTHGQRHKSTYKYICTYVYVFVIYTYTYINSNYSICIVGHPYYKVNIAACLPFYLCFHLFSWTLLLLRPDCPSTSSTCNLEFMHKYCIIDCS